MKLYRGEAWHRLEWFVSRRWLSSEAKCADFAFEPCGEGHATRWVPSDTQSGAIAYCGGAGLGAIFDFVSGDKKGMAVYNFDPTPGSIA